MAYTSIHVNKMVAAHCDVRGLPETHSTVLQIKVGDEDSTVLEEATFFFGKSEAAREIVNKLHAAAKDYLSDVHCPTCGQLCPSEETEVVMDNLTVCPDCAERISANIDEMSEQKLD